MKNKFSFIFIVWCILISQVQINFAQDQSTLAKFVIRNYDLNELPRVGSSNPDHLIVEF